MALAVVNIIAYDRTEPVSDACAEEPGDDLGVTRNGKTIARFERFHVRTWWIEEGV